MTWLIVLGALHILLCIVAGVLCRKAQEKQVGLAVVLCLIPIIGPTLIIAAYFIYQAVQDAEKKAKESQLS